jgi:hypothetical protein
MARQPETNFKVRALTKLNHRGWFFKTQQRALKGIPDLIGCVNGYFVALELKTDKGEADKLQKAILSQIRKNGGYAEIMTPSNMNKIIEEIEVYCGL